MDPELLAFRGGVRPLAPKKLADGKEHRLFYRARTPAEVSGFRGAIGAFPEGEEGAKKRDAYMARFLASAMCNEDESPLLTEAQAMKVPDVLKTELCLEILSGSSKFDDVGNV